MMRRSIQELGLTVLPMVLHKPGPETSMFCLIFSINIHLDYTSPGVLKHNYLKKADFKKGKDTQKQFSFLKM